MVYPHGTVENSRSATGIGEKYRSRLPGWGKSTIHLLLGSSHLLAFNVTPVPRERAPSAPVHFPVSFSCCRFIVGLCFWKSSLKGKDIQRQQVTGCWTGTGKRRAHCCRPGSNLSAETLRKTQSEAKKAGFRRKAEFPRRSEDPHGTEAGNQPMPERGGHTRLK